MHSRTTKAFEQAYVRLNAEQKEAVDTIDGPVMVVAGPGTGKTQTLALRIANILKSTDTPAYGILALTFTESGATAMRSRLISLIGAAAYQVTISTFHSFCADVIRENPSEFSINPSAEPLSDLSKFKLISQLLKLGSYPILRPLNAPDHYVQPILKSIQNLKREGVDPARFEDLINFDEKELNIDAFSSAKAKIELKNIAKNRELLELYRLYDEQLIANGQFDFEDMINFVRLRFQQSVDLLRIYQERYHYFLVDEYQDTNTSQNEIVEQLASFWGQVANLFVVGDPDQTIMRFQGAAIENMLGFLGKFPAAKIVTLTSNYRSNQTILDASGALISHNAQRISDVVKGLDPHLLAASKEVGTPITLAPVASSTAEAVMLADSIRTLIDAGTKPSNIAVIYRANQDAKILADIFVKFGIDYVIQGGGNVLTDPTVLHFLKILRVIHDLRDKSDDLGLFTVLHYDIFGVDALDVLKASRFAADHKLTLFDIMADPTLLDQIELASKAQILLVLRKLTLWQQIDANTTFVEFFEKVLTESGYLNWVLDQSDAHNRLSRLNTLFTAVKTMNLEDHSLNLSSFLHNIDLMQTHALRLEEVQFAPRDQAIILTTAHSAKGLEWDHVYVYKVIDGAWGNNASREMIKLPSGILPVTGLSLSKEDLKLRNLEDERRLFYVALTRARTSLTISYATSYTTYGKSREVSPSLFVAELPTSTVSLKQVGNTSDELSIHLQKLLNSSPTPPIVQSDREESYLRDLVSKFALSATALNSYLSCPYRFKLNNLLKVPRAKAAYLGFGTSVHAALESYLRVVLEGGAMPPLNGLLAFFKQALELEIMTKDEFDKRLSQGNLILTAYYNFFKDDFTKPLYLEKFAKVHLGGGSEDIILTGKIDRIDWLDQSAKTVRVVDYKTGKPKTKGQIMGTTQDSNGDLHRQLVFYKLLIDLDTHLNIKFGEAELDFVQSPHDGGKSGKHRFSISDAEVEALKATIHSVMSEIRVLHFPRTTDLSICSGCAFKDHCYPGGIPS